MNDSTPPPQPAVLVPFPLRQKWKDICYTAVYMRSAFVITFLLVMPTQGPYF